MFWFLRDEILFFRKFIIYLFVYLGSNYCLSFYIVFSIGMGVGRGFCFFGRNSFMGGEWGRGCRRIERNRLIM